MLADRPARNMAIVDENGVIRKLAAVPEEIAGHLAIFA
jgi:hypothetical protein